MPVPIPISDLRHNISEIFTAVVHAHSPVLVQRGGRDLGMLIGLEELERLLSVYSFHPEVLLGDDHVSIWLPEFALYGRGSSYEEAQRDLVEDTRDYVEDFFADADDYLHAPNRRDHLPHVVRVAVADLRGALAEVLFAAPKEPGDEPAPAPQEHPFAPAPSP